MTSVHKQTFSAAFFPSISLSHVAMVFIHVVPASCRAPTLTLTYWSMRSSTHSPKVACVTVSNVGKAAPISLFWTTNGLTNYWKCILNFLSTWLANQQGVWNRPTMSGTQILVHRWEPSTRILVLFYRSLVPAAVQAIPRVFAKNRNWLLCALLTSFLDPCPLYQ